MNNYKVKVNNEAESKEVQELFFELGYEVGACSIGFYPVVIITTKAWGTENWCSTRAIGLNHPAHENHKELTLPQLRDMVVLNRNDVNDATHECKQDPDFKYRLIDNNWHVITHNNKQWRKDSISLEEAPLFIKPIEKPMKEYLEIKEYLDPDDNFSYHKCPVLAQGTNWIEVPEGANIYARANDNISTFWSDEYQWTENGEVTRKASEDKGFSFSDWSKEWSAEILWQRPQQPEDLPFVDDDHNDSTCDFIKYMTLEQKLRFADGAKKAAESFAKLSKSIAALYEPKSLNDQYAEIEMVRQGLKYDSDKPRYSLLPKGSVNAVIDVLEFGAKKYEANNWQKVDNAKERYYNAAMRHIDLWWNGEKHDPETNIHHLAHAATNLFFLMWFDKQ